MSATEDIRTSAHLFGWDQHTTPDRHDILIKGDEMVDVLYGADGTVLAAELYWFYSVDNLQLRDRVTTRHKKQTVLSWLAEAS